MICTGCCTTLDHITTYLFKQMQFKGEKNEENGYLPIKNVQCSYFHSCIFIEKKTRQGLPVTNETFLQVLELHAGILQQILSTVLNIIMVDECRNQWSMSRPLLGLILLNEQVRTYLKKRAFDFDEVLYQICVTVFQSIEREHNKKSASR